ncbi:MAG: FtsH protease activity modulator HflK [Proteobacteria bacterium]|nr:FtsH protease activity modulator HflK [Pseudomonadota bacterium]
MPVITKMFSGPWGEDKGKVVDDKRERIIKETIMELKKESDKSGGNGSNYDDQIPEFNPSKAIPLVALAFAGLWLASGFYKIAPGEEGVVMRFGKYIQTTQPGLNYHLPAPIETVVKVNTQLDNSTEVGFRSVGNRSKYSTQKSNINADIRDISSESLMLTGDQKIVDLDFEVFWRIGNSKDFLFNVEDPQKTIHYVAEAAMREIIGTHKLDDALTDGKTEIKNLAKELISKTLDEYNSGIVVTSLQLQQVQPPKQVKAAFLDVKAALKDADRMRNEAQGYANDILPKARGTSAQIVQDAEAYAQTKVAESKGEASRFEQQLKAYNRARKITEKRLYIEAMEDVLSKSKKVIMSSETGNNVLPFLPLTQQQSK